MSQELHDPDLRAAVDEIDRQDRIPELTLPWVLNSEDRFEQFTLDHYGMPPADLADDPYRVVYVNAYEVSLAFGGPEEGGWWYDAGTPLASVPVHTRDEAIAAMRWLHKVYAERYGRDTRTNVNGDPDLILSVQDHTAASYPAERPRYE